MSDGWDPVQYERFSAERGRPFHDLLALVRARPGMIVLDLGCGTGELTAQLHRTLAARCTVGVDRSPAMLAKSAAFVAPGLCFRRAAIEDFAPEEAFDLVFSNAALQWVPEHAALLGRLRSWLAPGGQLAVQMPANHEHATHRLAAELASESPFREELGGFVRTSPVQRPERYAELLEQLGFREPRVRLEVYAHHLASRAEVVEWMKGTVLTAYGERLSATSYARFCAAYAERLLATLEDRRPYFWPFPRILLAAVLDE